MAKTDTIEQVAMICECTPEEIVIQKLGEKEEGPGKSRTYMDCTVTHTNHPIRPKDQTDMPGIGDQELVMSTAMIRGTSLSKYGLLKFDVKGAHHVVKKKRRCWKFLVVWVGGYFYIFKVGAFGDGSAGYYWGRVYATIHRIIYYVGDDDLWGMVFADDSLWNIPMGTIWEEAALILALLSALGLPFSWHKTLMGLAMTWVGFEISYKDWRVGAQLARTEEIGSRSPSPSTGSS